MFSKSKNNSKPIATNAPQNVKRGGKSAPSIFSTDLVIEGTLHSDGDIQIDGRVEGNIRSGSLTIGEKSVINGEIVANDVTIRGRVVGSIRARKVALSGTSHVEGDILHNALAVESGAFFDGNCRHADDPLTAEMPKGAIRSKTDKSSGPSNPLKVKAAAGSTNGMAKEPSSASRTLSGALGVGINRNN